MTAPAVVVLTLSPDELRALLRDVVDTALEARSPSPSTMSLVDRRELARALAVSAATVTRMTAEGLPHVYAGASPRYDPAEVRAWLAVRGRQGTKCAPSKREIIPGVRLLSRARGR